MTKSLSYITLLLLAIFGLSFTACQPQEDDVEEATLSLSEQTITFAKESASQTITVTTNQSKWTSFSTQEAWLTVEQQANALVVSATANDKPESRQGTIIVQAGGEQERIKVIQAASDASFDLEQEVYPVSQRGGKVRIAFTSNSNDVQVSLAQDADASWLTLGRTTAGGIDVQVAPNTSDDRRAQVREGKINIQVGNTISEVVIRQAGQDFYYLPLLRSYMSLAEIISLEKERGNELISVPDGLRNRDVYTIGTRSPLVPTIHYQVVSPTQVGYHQAEAIYLDSNEIYGDGGALKADFNAFLLEAGLVRDESRDEQGKQVWTLEDKPSPTAPAKGFFVVSIELQDDGSAIVSATYNEAQSQSYETFADDEEFPLALQSTWLRLDPTPGEKDTTDVKVYERSQGSLLTGESQIDGTQFWQMAGTPKVRNRFYNFVIPKSNPREPDLNIPPDDPRVGRISQAQAIVHPVTYCYWIDSKGEGQMTNEFKALLERKGYSFFRKFPGINGPTFDMYYHANDKRVLFMRPLFARNGEVIASIEVFPMDLTNGESARALSNAKTYNEFRTRLSERLLSTRIPMSIQTR